MKKGFLLLLFYSQLSWSLVGAGGYVPFGFSTQTNKSGSRGVFDLQPMIFVNGLFSVPYLRFFLPEFGYIHYRDLKDDYSKKGYYLLADFGYPTSQQTLIRYGVGIFMTEISGEGKAVTLNNGSSTATFYTPSESSKSYNVTWNLGIEQAINQNFSGRFELYIYEILSSLKRDLSYSFSVIYYL